MDYDGDALTSAMRFDGYRLSQAIVGRLRRSLVIYDECEDVLSDDGFARNGFTSGGKVTKALINNVLENNQAPSIWITNTVSGVDPAYLRRFDIVMQLDTPLSNMKKRLARRTFKDLPVSKTLISNIASHHAISPAHLKKAQRICARLGNENAAAVNEMVCHVLNGDLEAIVKNHFKHNKKTQRPKSVWTTSLH